jgi:glycosyltransferase involved in cell wall biosynthesis
MNGALTGGGALNVLARPAFRSGDTKPYNALLYSALKQLGVNVREFRGHQSLRNHSDVLHIHWPESLIEVRNPLAAWITAQKHRVLFRMARRRGTKIVWTIHDLTPHDCVYPDIELPFWQDFVRLTDGVIALTQTGLDLARDRYGCLRTVPAFVIPHGHFREAYPRSMGRNEARQKLGMPERSTVITYFGQVRPYKNIPQLVRAFRTLEDPNLRLLICGRLSKRIDLRQDILAAADEDPRIRLVLRYIKPDEIQTFLAAADLLVFPYAQILNSGSAILGLSFDRPILVPGLGALPELRRSVGEEWVQTYQGEIDGRTIGNAVAWAKSCPRPAQAPLDGLDWQRIGKQTLAAYHAVVRSNGSHRSR